MKTQLQAGLRYLAAAGLNLVAILDLVGLPADFERALAEADIQKEDFARLLLVGHGGRQLWRAFQAAEGPDGAPDPLDRFTRRHLDFVMQNKWGVPVNHCLYLYPLSPLSLPLPLQQLGSAAGWAHRSPIGSDMHPDFGLWFAYRAAVLIKDELPLLSQPLRPSPCDTCVEKPCMPACPAGAVGEIGRFGLNACISHRLQPRSSCASQCLARLACPVAPQHRYTAAQITYHYGHSIDSIRQLDD